MRYAKRKGITMSSQYKLKRCLAGILAAVIAVSAFSGCSGSSDSRRDDTEEYETEDRDDESDEEDQALNYGNNSITEDAATKYPDVWDVLPVIEETPVESFEYTYDTECVGIVITGYTGQSLRVNIPDTIDGEPVVAIDLKNSKLTQIVMPDTVKYAAINTSTIKHINYPRDMAFLSSKNHEGFRWDMMADHVYKNATILETVYISSEVTDMPDGVFDGCINLTNICYRGKTYSYENIEDLYNEIRYPDGYRIEDGVLLGCSTSHEGRFTIPDGVHTIGGKAFYNCSKITSIDIPDSVVALVSEQAFSGCTSLEEVNYLDATHTLQELFAIFDKLNMLTIENGVLIDCNEAINGEVNIPNTVSAIGDGAFSDCYNLTSVVFPKEMSYIGDSAFVRCYNLSSVAIPPKVEFISDHAFAYCYKLSSINIPNNVNSIGDYAFDNCCSLSEVIIPESVTAIGYSAFSGCISLSDIVIPNNIGYIGDRAFKDCGYCSGNNYAISYFSDLDSDEWEDADDLARDLIRSFKGLYDEMINISFNDVVYTYKDFDYDIADIINSSDGIYILGDTFKKCYENYKGKCIVPNGIKYIDEQAFEYCEELTEVILPDSIISIGEDAFRGCTSLTSIVIPNNVEVIYTGTFYGCENLISVSIPDSVTEIWGGAFEDCANLISIVIPDSVTGIGSFAFRGCTSLVSVTIPESVIILGDYAFGDCTSLTSIVIPDSVTTIGEAFNGCTNLLNATYKGKTYSYETIQEIYNTSFSEDTHPNFSGGTVVSN